MYFKGVKVQIGFKGNEGLCATMNGRKIFVSWTCQQNGVLIHTSNWAKSWFKENELRIMEWQVLLPEPQSYRKLLRITGNFYLCWLLSNFSSFCFENRVMEEWKNVPDELIKTFILSLHGGNLEVLERRGLHTHYEIDLRHINIIYTINVFLCL